MYSARKKTAQCAPLYSTKGPPTTSDSAWWMSKGVRPSSRQGGHEEEKQTERLNDGVADLRLGLVVDDLHDVEGLAQHRHGENGHDEGYFVADKLSGCAEASQDGVLVGGTPARHDESQNGQHGEGGDVEQAQVHVA